MQQRSVRRLALAALPVAFLAQCAPQCTPRPPTVAPWTLRATDVTPPGLSFNAVDGLTRDGRVIDLDLVPSTGRLVSATGAFSTLPYRGDLTQDGSAVVGLTANYPQALRRYDVATGVDRAYPALPFGWTIDDGWGVEIDDTGRHIGVVAQNGALADTGAFVLDTATRAWTRPDEPLGVQGMANSSRAPRFSADGSSVVFEYVNGPTGCLGCDEIWLSGPSGLALVNIRSGGGAPTTGNSWLLDVSPDARYVLFASTATDLGRGGGAGFVYVRDTVLGRTRVVVSGGISTEVGSISDDGQVVAYEDSQGVPWIVVNGGTSGAFTRRVSPAESANDAVNPYSSIELTGSGTRVVYTTVGNRVVVADFDGTGR